MSTPPSPRSPRPRKVAMYEDVAERVRQKIYDHELAPGDWIDEPALAAEFGISRTPLRECLKLLAAEGLVQIDPGRGASVTKLTLEDLNELFPVMAMLEGRCAFECARKLDAERLRTLETLHEALETAAAAGDVAAYYASNYVFHRTVQDFAGNPWLTRVTNDLRRILKMHRGRQLLLPGRLQESLSEHRALIECFRSHDAGRAERVMNQHLLHQRVALVRYIESGGSLNGPARLPDTPGAASAPNPPYPNPQDAIA
ncbi:GntR family transcriptional regulator [Plasticicumulans sp.]|uniref:GntR family transcriptional regulator n=1 Tax=Plasticicumulans sp. TaxID=2307179 RepID=UPI000FA919AA|nr:GntR family transcriptional regulator [Pseudomonadota bacterium]RTL06255.1 MAG: GntR family transcriptional regulator [Xanthomonadales bacterium]HMZ11020.1 GntR family transcriptional regulator [Plasticicumulans sp.]HNB90309.1 GntR family transcriptional regulator [Plasticicumulans sp.]HNF66651.1 GntR family transcriptional regulator [Plasticicumulans sp.]